MTTRWIVSQVDKDGNATGERYTAYTEREVELFAEDLKQRYGKCLIEKIVRQE